MTPQRITWRGWLAKWALGLVLALLVCAGLLYFFLGDDLREYFSRVPFDSAAWKDPQWSQPGESQNPLRLRMVDDLLGRYHLVGMSQAEVDELLGAPTDRCPFAGYDYAYWLGPERAYIAINSEWLVLKFQQDRVVEARVVRD